MDLVAGCVSITERATCKANRDAPEGCSRGISSLVVHTPCHHDAHESRCIAAMQSTRAKGKLPRGYHQTPRGQSHLWINGLAADAAEGGRRQRCLRQVEGARATQQHHQQSHAGRAGLLHATPILDHQRGGMDSQTEAGSTSAGGCRWPSGRLRSRMHRCVWWCIEPVDGGHTFSLFNSITIFQSVC